MKTVKSTSDGLEATMEKPTTRARITHSGTRFFQFTSLKLQNGTFDTIVTPANTATPQVSGASHW